MRFELTLDLRHSRTTTWSASLTGYIHHVVKTDRLELSHCIVYPLISIAIELRGLVKD
jgi:hypothetical protein